LVLEAQIGGFTSKKVFMDGGSSLNLIYADTLRKIKILLNNLLPTETSFHGIIPGKPTYPLGAIHLDVIFGTPANFRKEKIEFEVVDWPSQYMLSSGGQRSPDSWRYPTTPTSSCGCPQTEDH
jgi:hypothetical protein